MERRQYFGEKPGWKFGPIIVQTGSEDSRDLSVSIPSVDPQTSYKILSPENVLSPFT